MQWQKCVSVNCLVLYIWGKAEQTAGFLSLLPTVYTAHLRCVCERREPSLFFPMQLSSLIMLVIGMDGCRIALLGLLS